MTETAQEPLEFEIGYRFPAGKQFMRAQSYVLALVDSFENISSESEKRIPFIKVRGKKGTNLEGLSIDLAVGHLRCRGKSYEQIEDFVKILNADGHNPQETDRHLLTDKELTKRLNKAVEEHRALFGELYQSL